MNHLLLLVFLAGQTDGLPVAQVPDLPVAQVAAVESPRPRPFPTDYAEAVQWAKDQDTPIIVYVGIPTDLDTYLPAVRTAPHGGLKQGEVYRCWWKDGAWVGELVNRPKAAAADWKDDAWHRHSPLPGDHMHQCAHGHTWYHNGANSFGDVRAHTCPVCGMQDWQPKTAAAKPVAAPVRYAPSFQLQNCPSGH